MDDRSKAGTEAELVRSRDDRYLVFSYYSIRPDLILIMDSGELLRDSAIGSLTDVIYFCSFRPITLIGIRPMLFCSIELADSKTKTNSFRLILNSEHLASTASYHNITRPRCSFKRESHRVADVRPIVTVADSSSKWFLYHK
jgi:hypothetical protein